MKKLFFILIIFPILVGASLHKYYLSVTDVTFNEESKSVQIITRLFYDDLEDVLQERYDSDILMDATYDQEKLDKYLEKYVSQKLIITIDGEQRKNTFVGKEFEDDYVVCYIEVVDVSAIHHFSIVNTLLTDLFPDQKNMIHTKVNTVKKSFLLTRENPKGLLNF